MSAGVVPANLSYLAIYNPSSSSSDDTFHEQILYYYSSGKNVRRNGKARDEDEDSKDHKNERERQIGLAQGMVEFAK